MAIVGTERTARERRTAGQHIRAHVALTKPRIIELLLVTAVPTMFLAAQGLPTWRATVAVLVGGACAAGAANTFNSLYDRDIDALMHRTIHRPAVLGSVSIRAGFIQGLVLSAASIIVLSVLANPLSALLALLAIVGYAVGYTMVLKRRTDQNIVWGGAAGCMPVLIAWSAVTGSLSWAPIVLFMIVFWWTPPHYWPLAIKYREDYRAAGVPMLPVVRSPRSVARHIVTYSWLMVVTSLSLIFVAPVGWVYGLGAAVVGAVFLVQAYRLWGSIRKCASDSANEGSGVQSEGTPDYSPLTLKIAMQLFHGSISYLAIIFLLVAVSPFVG
ncbi:MAG: heme o synthase [Candidatus Nanopelagicales bacterium]